MAQPVTVAVTGAISAAPSTPAAQATLQSVKPFFLQRTYSYRLDQNLTINSPVSPVEISLGSITKVRFVALTVIGSSVQLLVTSGAGTDQTVKVSEFFLFSAPSEGDQLTAIKIQGVSDVEMILLGD